MHLTGVLLSFLLAILQLTSAKNTKTKDAVLLSNVRSLTLHADKQTSNRRVSAIPQLTCVGGTAKGLYNVDVMRCKNSGSEYDAEDIQWTCQASLPPEFKLGSTEVVCEGYDSPDDPYILKGSCGVEYRLVLTELGEEKYARKANVKTFKTKGDSKNSTSGFNLNQLLNSLWNILFWLVFIGVVATIVYKIFVPPTQANRPARNPNRGGGGGGPDDSNDDPPPPYTPRAPPRPKSKPQNAPRPSSSTQQQWRPGFWTGTAAGGAAGYGAGYYQGARSAEREREAERQREHERESQRQREHQSSLFNNRSWFNDSGRGGGGGYGGAGGGSSAAGPSYSSSRQESTGFGGTSRR